jgi:hypothetical protein
MSNVPISPEQPTLNLPELPPDEWPETPTVPVRFSTQLLRQLADPPEPNPYRGIRLWRLGQPDAEGFYTPVFGMLYDPPRKRWWQRLFR